MTMPTLHLRLLGDFSLLYNDQQVTNLNTTRLRSLLAYLVLHRDVPQQRQHLAFLFWPDAAEAQARNNLRQLLHQLRQALPAVEQFLSAGTHMLHWHPVTPCHLDVAEFEQSLTLADAATRHNDQHALQAALEQADSLYRGELLPGCYQELYQHWRSLCVNCSLPLRSGRFVIWRVSTSEMLPLIPPSLLDS